MLCIVRAPRAGRYRDTDWHGVVSYHAHCAEKAAANLAAALAAEIEIISLKAELARLKREGHDV